MYSKCKRKARENTVKCTKYTFLLEKLTSSSGCTVINFINVINSINR